MRNFTSNPARIIIKAAVEAVRNDQSRPGAQMRGNTQASRGTTAATDGNGVVTTQHAMMWDMDKWDDEGSLWS